MNATSHKTSTAANGPLRGVRVLEFAGIGPAPVCGMLLAGLGADVVRVDRATPADIGIPRPLPFDIPNRSKRSVILDLKQLADHDRCLALLEKGDILIEGFRPGTMERLGLGPDVCLKRNPQLVYGRVTGWGQTGPLSQAAGHDLNFIALTGALHAIGRSGSPPTPPLNLLGDYGGGAMFLAVGVLAALVEARRSGVGQVVDAAIIDGTNALLASIFGLWQAGMVGLQRGENLLDGGAPQYDVYRCADGCYVAVACLEPKFRSELLRLMEIDHFPDVQDPANWPSARMILSARFAEKSRDEWRALLEGTDACFAPVLSLAEAPHHPHNQRRGTYVSVEGVVQPAPGPRFSRTPLGAPRAAEALGASTEAVFQDWGVVAQSG